MPALATLRKRRERQSALVTFCLLLGLGLGQGCSRSESLHRDHVVSSATEQTLPFHADAGGGPTSDGVLAAAVPDPNQASSLPFRDGSEARILPAGTLLTVQLENSLYATKVSVGEVFTAFVATPFMLERDTLVEGGTIVTGRVESARPPADRSGRGPASGYFRLTLSSITQDGRRLPLQTSSLFARGTFQPSEGLRVPKGRRLTFRLTAPVTLDAPNPTASR